MCLCHCPGPKSLSVHQGPHRQSVTLAMEKAQRSGRFLLEPLRPLTSRGSSPHAQHPGRVGTRLPVTRVGCCLPSHCPESLVSQLGIDGPPDTVPVPRPHSEGTWDPPSHPPPPHFTVPSPARRPEDTRPQSGGTGSGGPALGLGKWSRPSHPNEGPSSSPLSQGSASWTPPHLDPIRGRSGTRERRGQPPGPCLGT